ncbi:MAG: isochorismatase family protein, partial [Kangiellaceae bacterium]|nr:isochorismatase family protein [Kangiellaceae bacterium]
CALENGFDAHVIKDACLGHSNIGIDAAFERLKQAGVVMVSWRQVLMEWNQGGVELSQLRRIMKPV